MILITKAIERVKSEFEFNIKNVGEYNVFTNFLWEQDFKKLFDDKLKVTNLNQSIWLSIQHKMMVIYLASVFESLFTEAKEIIYNVNFKAFENSEKKISYKEAFEAGSLEDLKWKVIGKAIHESSYKSLIDQIEELEKKYNFCFVQKNNDKDLKNLTELFEVRNILLHNKGIINKIFIRKTGWPNHMDGSFFPMEEDRIEDWILSTRKLGGNIISTLKAKFNNN